MPSDCIRTVSPSVIRTEGMQIRAETSREHIDELRELFDEDLPTWPADLPPVVVFIDGKTYWLAEGHHRLAAAIEAGCTEIRVQVKKGSKTDALLFACGANAGHGLRRTSADKRNAVLTAYRINPGNTNRAIAKLCKVTHSMVNDILREARQPKAKVEESSTPAPSAAPSASTVEKVEESSTPAEKVEESSTPATSAEPASAESKPPITAERIIREAVYTPPAPAKKAEPFAEALDFFGNLEAVIQQAQRLVNQIATMRGAELYRGNHLRAKQTTRNGEQHESHYSPDLADALSELRHWRPFKGCPHCHPHGAPQHDCTACKGLGYVTEAVWQRCPEKLRLAMEGER